MKGLETCINDNFSTHLWHRLLSALPAALALPVVLAYRAPDALLILKIDFKIYLYANIVQKD